VGREGRKKRREGGREGRKDLLWESAYNKAHIPFLPLSSHHTRTKHLSRRGQPTVVANYYFTCLLPLQIILNRLQDPGGSN
jgi:hypothetical protein